MSTLSFPIVLVSVAAMGVAVRRVAEERQRAVEETTRARSAAAAAHERLRLARELHDTVAKSVQGVALTATALHRWIERDPVIAAQHAETVAAGARDALAAARGLLTSLRVDDPERSLAQVLDEIAGRWESRHDSIVERDLVEVTAPSLEQRHELVSAVQEALENVARHAPGAAVVMRLVEDDGCLTVTVSDDGPGFEPQDEILSVHEGHYGLTGLRERLASVGGRTEISSVPGSGTRVRLIVPYPGASLPEPLAPTRRLPTQAAGAWRTGPAKGRLVPQRGVS